MAELTVDFKLRAGTFALEVAFSAPPGVTVLFGPSGAGKSTTLAAIAGLIRPASGRIALGDEVWFDETIDRPVHRRGVALVFQSLALFPHMTAADNVAYGLDRALPAAERRSRALEMLERMRVSQLADAASAQLLRRRGAAGGAGPRLCALAAAGAAR